MTKLSNLCINSYCLKPNHFMEVIPHSFFLSMILTQQPGVLHTKFAI